MTEIFARRFLTPELMTEFFDRFFVPADAATVPFDYVWRKWVLFVQTHNSTRLLFPVGLPRTPNVLSMFLRREFQLITKLQAITLRRGDRHLDQKPNRNYTVMVGLKMKNSVIPWRGANKPWFPNNWVVGGSGTGNVVVGVDPRWIIYNDLLVLKKRRLIGGLDKHKAQRWFETELEKQIKVFHTQHDIDKDYPTVRETPVSDGSAPDELTSLLENLSDHDKTRLRSMLNRSMLNSEPSIIPPPIAD